MGENTYMTMFNESQTHQLENYGDVMNVNEVMEVLGIGKNSAYNLFRTGEIKAFQLSGKWKVTKQSLKNFLKKQNEQYSNKPFQNLIIKKTSNISLKILK